MLASNATTNKFTRNKKKLTGNGQTRLLHVNLSFSRKEEEQRDVEIKTMSEDVAVLKKNGGKDETRQKEMDGQEEVKNVDADTGLLEENDNENTTQQDTASNFKNDGEEDARAKIILNDGIGTDGRLEFLMEIFNGVASEYEDDPVASAKKLLEWIPLWPKNDKDGPVKDLSTLLKKIIEGNQADSMNAFTGMLKVSGLVATATLVHSRVRNSLVFMANEGQENGGDTSTAGQKRSHAAMKEPDSRSEFRDAIDVATLPSQDDLINKSVDLHILESLDGRSKIWDVDGLSGAEKQSLKSFNDSFQEAFEKAKVIEGRDDQEEDFLSSLHHLRSRLSGDSETTDQLQIPHRSAPEVKFAQPFLLALLESLGERVDEWKSTLDDQEQQQQPEASNENPPSPEGKTNININRFNSVYSSSSSFEKSRRKNRYVDKSMAINTRYAYLFRDDCVEVSVEEKTGEGKSGPRYLLVTGETQEFSHLAKHVGVGFEFRDIGVDTKSTGIVLTPHCMKVVQLELVNVGTKDVKLKKTTSPLLPLLLQKNFNKWVEGSQFKTQWKEMAKEMYPSPSRQGEEIPGGITALWKFMTCSRKNLFGSIAPTEVQENEIGAMIAFGSFSTIHRIVGGNGNENKVMKISRYGAHYCLAKEAKILKDLASSGDGANVPRSIVKFVSYSKNTPCIVNGVQSQIPTLTLSPRGTKMEAHIAKQPCDQKLVILRQFCTELLGALEFLWKRSLFHNDVTPKNMLVNDFVNQHGQVDFHPLLVDFGIASGSAYQKKNSKQNKGFRGTPRFAHRDVFYAYPDLPWDSKPEYDHCGLALSFASLAGNGSFLWPYFQPTKNLKSKGDENYEAFETWIEKRGKRAWASLRTLELDSAKKWENLCFCRSSESSSIQ